MQKTLAILLTLSLARSANRLFSKWTLQNGARNETWQPARRLVILTGGTSDIRKQVMEDLSRTGVWP
jgi:hypothetical protein